MDALREQYEGGFKMSAYKDKTQGTWYVSFRYIDWTGKKMQKLKRGFKTKKEALNYEKEFIRKTAADMKMEMNSFIQVYFEDKKNELKENSIRNKQHMMNKHIVPYFGTRKMNEITPAEIIQWQNAIQEKGYSKTYERMIQNQLAVLAEKYHCAVILIGHMNKNSNGKSSYRGLGSIDFQAAARSVLIVGRVKEEPEVRVVCHTKSSLAPEGMSIAFRLDKNNGFEWIGEYDISADELLNGDGRGQKSQKAKEFLLEILANGGMAQKKIAEEAEGRGIKGKTLWNAKRELEIDSVKRGKQWYWMLPE